jgi:hypothetical protein
MIFEHSMVCVYLVGDTHILGEAILGGALVETLAGMKTKSSWI